VVPLAVVLPPVVPPPEVPPPEVPPPVVVPPPVQSPLLQVPIPPPTSWQVVPLPWVTKLHLPDKQRPTIQPPLAIKELQSESLLQLSGVPGLTGLPEAAALALGAVMVMMAGNATAATASFFNRSRRDLC
jgi:hypothetical protein